MGGWSPLQLRPLQLPGSLRQAAEAIRPSLFAVGVGRAVGRALDDLEWHDLEVDGRRAFYGVGGEGLPVVFLHGWGLGHRAYQRALRRLIAHGCRVYAPAMPGFGGTADLPRDERTIEGYAAWVDSFLAAVGVTEPALVLGHSFGGGVSIKLAHDHPGRVRYLVLLNSVGGPAWGPDRVGQVMMGDRPFWAWAVDAGREFLPSRETYDVARAVTHDFTLNVLENPLAVMEVGMLARRADLRAELAELGQRSLPVLVLWSDHDQVLPLSSFEALCKAIGVDGRVVEGGHSWLLANPDAFSQVLANVVQVQVDEHRSTSATALAGDILERLQRTSVPSRTAKQLLAAVSPHWLMSESPAVLAGDLALCHPRLAPGEVRAVARPVDDPTSSRLTVVAPDRPGLLADTAAVLALEGVSVRAASAATWPAAGLALHALTFEAPRAFDEARWDALGQRLRELGAGASPTPR